MQCRHRLNICWRPALLPLQFLSTLAAEFHLLASQILLASNPQKYFFDLTAHAQKRAHSVTVIRELH
jgi:hypothetical protein